MLSLFPSSERVHPLEVSNAVGGLSLWRSQPMSPVPVDCGAAVLAAKHAAKARPKLRNKNEKTAVLRRKHRKTAVF